MNGSELDNYALPHGATTPLHILPTITFYVILTIIALLLAYAALWLLLWWLRKRREQNAATNSDEKARRPSRLALMRRRLKSLEEEATASGNYRLALHQLSDTMRDYLQSETDFPFRHSTFSEIFAILPLNEPTTFFFDRLDHRRFERNDIFRDEFERQLKSARGLLGAESRIRSLLRRLK